MSAAPHEVRYVVGTMGAETFSPGCPLSRFVLPAARDYRIASEVVDSHPVVSAFASCEWDELSDDGREWMAAVVREAQARVALSADTIVRVNAFLTYMADRYRERTSRRILGIRLHAFTREQAMGLALATFDAQLDLTQIVFGDPAYGWDRDHANEIVDEDLQHWEV